jgi:hypothetical protein
MRNKPSRNRPPIGSCNVAAWAACAAIVASGPAIADSASGTIAYQGKSGPIVLNDAGPRLNYWFVANDQLVQYSGTATPDTLKLATDTPQRVAGKLTIDDSKAGGAKASVEFDATLLKEFSKGR